MSTQYANTNTASSAARQARNPIPSFVIAFLLGNFLGLFFMILFQASRAPRARDIFGTAFAFTVLLQFTFIFILGEKFLENFKSH